MCSCLVLAFRYIPLQRSDPSFMLTWATAHVFFPVLYNPASGVEFQLVRPYGVSRSVVLFEMQTMFIPCVSSLTGSPEQPGGDDQPLAHVHCVSDSTACHLVLAQRALTWLLRRRPASAMPGVGVGGAVLLLVLALLAAYFVRCPPRSTSLTS